MESLGAAVAAEGFADSGAPEILNAGDLVRVLDEDRASSLPIRARGTWSTDASGARSKRPKRRHKKSTSMCPSAVEHGCQYFTKYYGGACLVQQMESAGAV